MTQTQTQAQAPQKPNGGASVPAASPMNTIRDLLDRVKGQMEMAAPKHLNINRLIRVSLTAIQKTPRLMECDTKSLLGAIMQSAQLGLEPDGNLGRAYLIPYYNGKTKRYEVQFQIGYKGLLVLARRSGEIVSISAQVVHARDVFEFEYGIEEKLRHVPAGGDRGEIVAAYAVARLKGGGYQFDVMTREDVDKIRAGSKAKDDGPWATHYAEMARKTVLKRLCKYLPQAVEAQDAASLDDQVEAGVIEMDAPPAAMLEGKTADRAANLKNRLANASQVGGDMVDMETGEVIEEKSPGEGERDCG